MKKLVVLIVIISLFASQLSFAKDNVSLKQISPVKVAVNGLGALFMTGGLVISASASAHVLNAANYDGMSPVLLVIIFGAPLATAVSGTGVTMGGVQFLELLSEFLSKKANSKQALAQYKMIAGQAKIFEQDSSLLDMNLNQVLQGLKCDSCRNPEEVNQQLLATMRAAKQFAGDAQGEWSMDEVFDFMVKNEVDLQFVESNKATVLGILSLEVAKLN